MYCCHPLKQRCMQATPRVTGEGGGRLGLGVGVGRTLKESSSAKDVSKEAETVLGVCTTVLKTFYLKVGTV